MPQSPQSRTRTRDLLGYAGSPPDPRWPGGARVAVSIVVNFEEGGEFSVTDGDPENEAVYAAPRRPTRSGDRQSFRIRFACRLVADYGGAGAVWRTGDSEL